MIQAILLVAVSTLLACLRISGHKSEPFQAVAHLFVGGLLGSWLVGRKAQSLQLALAAVLSLIELACFFLLKP